MTLASLRAGPTGPFDHDAALATLLAHRIEGLHAIDPVRGVLERWIDVGGSPVAVTLRIHPTGVTVRARTGSRTLEQVIQERVRGWFDLGTDITPVDALFSADSVLGPLVAARPGVRITRFHGAFEAALFTVIGQQVSLAAARLFGSRLVAAYGADAPDPTFGGGLRMLPDPETIARQRADELRECTGLTRARARAVQAVAELFASIGDTESLPPRDTLRAAYGVGPWTVDYLAIRAGTDPDAFPVTDAVLRRALTARGASDPAATIERWRPWRSYAASRLWAVAYVQSLSVIGQCRDEQGR